jgi:hypothetical protein
MPLYEFAYQDENGDEQRFETFMNASDYKAEIPSPCGQFIAKRVFTSVPTHFGLSAAEKAVGVTNRRKEFGKWGKDMREKRQREHAPGTREHDSNEIWTGGENLKGILPEDKMVNNVMEKREREKMDKQLKEIAQKKSI